MFKIRFVFIIIILFQLSVIGKKVVLPTELIAIKSDLIVLGEISEVNEKSYQLNILKVVKGNQSSKEIKIKKWKEWECDSRRFELKVKTKLFVFLKKKLGSWEIINDSSGEVLFEKNLVILNDYAGTKVLKDDFVYTIIAVVDNFSFPHDPYSLFWEPKNYLSKSDKKSVEEIMSKYEYSKMILKNMEESGITY